MVLADGYSRGRRYHIGNMSYFLGKGVAKRNGFKKNEPIYLSDDVIIKYVNHPKAKKGANVPPEYMNLMAKAISRPKNIYTDSNSKNKGAKIYVGTIPKNKNKVIKAVIHTYFKKNGEVYHKVKSFGIVDKRSFRNSDYTKIK